MATRNDTYRGLLLAAGILVITLMASVRGYLSFVNGAVYDWVSMIPLGAPAARQAPVLLIDVDRLDFHVNDDGWRALADALSAATPRQVVLLERPSRLNRATYQHLANFVDVIGVAAPPWHLPGAEAVVGLQAWSSQPISDHGVFRRMSLAPALDPPGATLLARAAAGHSGHTVQLDEVYPNFLSGSNRPPRLSATRLLDGEIPASVIAARTLLLAPSPSASVPKLFTPGGDAGVTDAAAFQARALHSLLTNRYILQFPPLSTIGCVIVLGVGCLYFYQRAGLSVAVYFTAGAMVVAAAMTVGLLHALYVWFPVAELVITMLGMWVVVLNRKYVTEQHAMLLELNNISELMQQRLVPADVLHSESYWEKIAYMVQGLLQLDRSIFLETLPDERRVREIYAINCELSDIDERRRDYERTPYTTALRAKSPIMVDRYLVQGQAGEQQYLVPLQVDGKVLGFWAFGVPAERLAAFADKLSIVARLAEDISELLYQRQELREQDHRSRRHWLDYLLLQGGRSVARDLKAALLITTRRLRIVEELFEHSDTAYLLYDTFGQLLLDNRAAARLCETYGIEAYELSYADALARLAGLDLETAKSQLQRVLIDGESVSLPLRLEAEQGPHGRLTLTALSAEVTQDGAPDGHAREASAFAVSGLVIEIWLAGQTLEHNGIPSWIRELFELQGQLLGNGVGAAAGGPDADAVAVLGANSNRFLAAIDHATAESGELCSLAQAIEAAAQQHKYLARRKRLHLDVAEACEQILPMLPRRQLLEVMAELVRFAMTDAKRGSRLTLELLQSWPTAHLQIANDGIGLPAQRLEELKNPARRGQQSRFMRCRDTVRRFAGELEVTSEVGKTTVIDLLLPALPTTEGSR